MNKTQHTEHKHHITPLWIYLAVGGALLILTGLTIAAAQINFTALTGFSEMNFVIAMTIATIKAVLVALFFMHLLYDSKFYLFSLLSAIATLMIFITLTLVDTQFRGHVNPVEALPIIQKTPTDKFVKSGYVEHEENEQAPRHE